MLTSLLRRRGRSAARNDRAANPDHAWKALGLVNEWIRHADAKAGVTLAFTGVLAAMLFNLVKDFESRTVWSDAVVVAACVLLVVTGGLCAWTLTPRVRDKDASNLAINRLFYASISKNFKGDRHRYVDVLHTLTADSDELTRDIAHQVHANAEIATTKSRWATWAIRSAVAAGAAVALLAILIGAANSQG
ncbi:DUF5706 domain-containing protein [Microbacterium sp. cx-55]|uniref:Pycsar system effector family protein n=1 Tax=Microbacterium sp. cx-55 TaxID=2875948 RepID=UPI001CBCB8ED|nr:Pycsar system effector family protein [Microbacterium sp. cx-55]MBZ4487418.1 DUF5706 domain-containing protein [Microbacterium sp. cx-55]UGB35438.1 DUF5706 domain-containing protein [Microbacterium sp. cx-55]